MTPPATGARRPLPRRRSGAGIILLPPWTRAPFLSFRQPAVILAVLGAASFAGSAVAVAAVIVLAALYAQRSADRADVSEVLRLG